ncbi:glycosyltransferase [Acinetobacter baumannii]
MAKILFTGAFRFPDGDAASLRLNNMINILKPYYDEILVCGWEQKNKSLIDNQFYLHNSIKCFPQAELDNNSTTLLEKFGSFIYKGERTLNWIENYFKKDTIEIIVVYNPPALFALKLISLCKKYNIKLILDSTEWYDSSHLPMGRFGLPAIENFIRMHYVYPKIPNIISISHYLNNYYSKKSHRPNINQMVLPIVLDCHLAAEKPSIEQGINFIYAGNLGKKDNIIDFINYLPTLHQQLNCLILFNIAGVTFSQLKDLLGSENFDRIQPYIKCHGRLSRSDVIDLYSKSHFSVLFRDDKRYAHAGFPTKLVESWSMATPVICNPIGDITLYAQHGENACIVNDINEVAKFLGDVLKNNQYKYMQQQCQETIELKLSNKVYSNQLLEFFRRLK